MINPDIYAYLATTLNIVMLIPQVVRAWKTKHTKDLSFTTLLIFVTACILWTLYGIAKQAMPIIVTNLVVGSLNVILIIIKLTNPEKG